MQELNRAFGVSSFQLDFADLQIRSAGCWARAAANVLQQGSKSISGGAWVVIISHRCILLLYKIKVNRLSRLFTLFVRENSDRKLGTGRV